MTVRVKILCVPMEPSKALHFIRKIRQKRQVSEALGKEQEELKKDRVVYGKVEVVRKRN